MKRFCAAGLTACLLLCTACICGESESYSVSYLYPSGTSSAQQGDLPEYSGLSLPMPYLDPNIHSPSGVADFDFYYDRLESDAERAVYQSVVEAQAAFARKTILVAVPGDFTAERASEIFEYVQMDYPQFFENYMRYTPAVENGTASFTLNYAENSIEKLREDRERFYGRVNQLLEEAAAFESREERRLFLYETVMKSAEYDFAEFAFIGVNIRAHTAYGCLIDGKTVCDGYAKAFSLLANYSGIRSMEVRGHLSGDVYHAWIGVETEGGYLFCDPTLDDAERRYAGADGKILVDPPEKEGKTLLPDAVLHTYYNLSYSEMAKNHTFAISGFADLKTPPAERYQLRNGALFSEKEELASWLAAELPRAGAGETVEFGIDFKAKWSEIWDLLPKNRGKYALSANGGNTNFAVYTGAGG